MKHSDLQKEYHVNKGVICSGNRLCYSCKVERKLNKRFNNKSIRRLNKKLCSNED